MKFWFVLLMCFSLNSFARYTRSSRYLEQFNAINKGQNRVNLDYTLLSIDNSGVKTDLSGQELSFERGYKYVNLAFGFSKLSGELTDSGAKLDTSTTGASLTLRKWIKKFYYNLDYIINFSLHNLDYITRFAKGEIDLPSNDVVLTPNNHFALTLGYAIGKTWGVALKYTPSYLSKITSTTGTESDVNVSSATSFKLFKEYSLSNYSLIGFDLSLNTSASNGSTRGYGF